MSMECVRDGCEKSQVGHDPDRKPKYTWFCEEHLEEAKDEPMF